MKQAIRCLVLLALALLVPAAGARAEILAMLNYETKPEQSVRKEGLAVIDVDPTSPAFGKVLMDIPLPPDLVAHHIVFNRDKSKAYITALGKSVLHVMDLTRFPYRIKAVPVPDCQVLEDVVFSADAGTWYLTCMGSSAVVMGDATTDTPTRTITAPSGAAFIRYPHGISVHDGIDRLMVSSTVRPSDLGDPGETVTVLEASTGKVLSTHKLSLKPSPSGEAPVETMVLSHANPPVAYITNMYGGTLWMAVWNAAGKTFDFSQVDDLGKRGQGIFQYTFILLRLGQKRNDIMVRDGARLLPIIEQLLDWRILYDIFIHNVEEIVFNFIFHSLLL